MSQRLLRLFASLSALTGSALLIATAIGALRYAQGSAAAGSPAPTAQAAAVLPCWIADYEPGQKWDRIDAKPGGFRIVPTPVRHGNHAGQFILPAADAAATSQRSEVARIRHQVEGDDTWLAWALYLPSDGFLSEPGRNVIITEWVGGPLLPGSTEVQVFVRNIGGLNYFGLAARGGNQDQTTDRNWTFERAPYDQWVDMKMHVHWASTDAGFIELWIGGHQVLAKNTPTIYQGTYVYLEQGFARTASKLSSTLYQDGTVVSAQESGLSCPSSIVPTPGSSGR
jgi:hypothetical protein